MNSPLLASPAALRLPDGGAAAEAWTLDEASVHINHGSFGAVPRVTQDLQNSLRAEMDAAPVAWFPALPGLVKEARTSIAAFLDVDPARTALVPNASAGASVVYSSLPVTRGLEIVVTDHGYGAVTMGAERLARRWGGTVRTAHIPLAATAAEAHDAVVAEFSDRTALVVIDQITSPTALLLPVAEVAAAVAPVPVLVDAAHVPGALPGLDIEALGVAYWVGNLHKWAFAPRSTAVLWADPERRNGLRPLVTSWSHGEPYPDSFDLQGTVDHSAWLAIPDAINFWQRLGGWDQVERNIVLLRRGADHVAKALGAGSELSGIPSAPCMTLVPLPDGVGESPEAAEALWQQLYAAGFVVPPVSFGGRGFVRLAAHVYNDEDDYARLAETLVTLVRGG